MSYGRCELHGLMRCVQCNPPVAPAVMLNPSPVPTMPVGWSPEDALDSMPGPGVIQSTVSPTEIDEQAKAAIARQQEILKARGDMEGEPQIEMPSDVNEELVGVIKLANGMAEEITGKTVQQIMEAVIAPEPPFKFREESNLVKAAREVSDAKERVASATSALSDARDYVDKCVILLNDYQNMYDTAKARLQNLVLES